MPRQRSNPSNATNNQGCKAVQKENEKSPESELEHMEISDAYDRAFMFSVPRILNEI